MFRQLCKRGKAGPVAAVIGWRHQQVHPPGKAARQRVHMRVPSARAAGQMLRLRQQQQVEAVRKFHQVGEMQDAAALLCPEPPG